MEQIHEIIPAAESNGITWEAIKAKGAEADAATKEVERIIEELKKAGDEKDNAGDAAGRAMIEQLLPQYKEALAKEDVLEKEWMELLEKYSRPRPE